MTTYMGPGLGSLVPVRCLSSLQVQADARSAVADGLSGRRMYVDRPGTPTLRTWAASIGVADPAELGTLFQLASLRQPLWMVTDAARVENVFTPNGSLGLPARPGGSNSVPWLTTVGGPVALAGGGFAAVSAMPRFTNTFSPLLPVIPGERVSVGVNVRAESGTPVTVRLDWMALGTAFNGTQQAIAASTTSSATAAPLPRVELSATPPSNVHVARLSIVNAAQFANPSLTWTATAQPWRPGGGAESVYLPEPSQSVILAWSDGRALSSYSYTVTEVSA